MQPIELLQLKEDALDRLLPFAERVFRATFEKNTSPENMDAYVAANFQREKLSQELRSPHSRFFGTFSAGRLTGYLKVNFGPAQTELKDAQALEIERIYVDPLFFGRRIGQLLMDKAIRLGQEAGLQYLWLGVWEYNERALAFYHKNGFRPFDKHPFVMGTDAQTDVMMRRSLKA